MTHSRALFSRTALTLALALGAAPDAGLAASGDLLWEFQEASERWALQCGDLAVDGDTAVVTFVDRLDFNDDAALVIRGHSTADGSVRWRREIDSESPADLFAGPGRVTVLTQGSVLLTFDTATGKRLWSRRVSRARGLTSLAGSTETLVVAGVDTKGRFFVAALDAATGKTRWARSPGRDGAWAEDVVVAGDSVFATGRRAKKGREHFAVHGYSLSSGNALWKDDSSRGRGFELDTRGGRVFAVGWAGESGSLGSTVRAYDGRTGRVLWSKLQSSRSYRRVVATPDTVVAGGTRFRHPKPRLLEVVALDPATGGRQWRRTDRRFTLWDLDVHGSTVYEHHEAKQSLGQPARPDFIVARDLITGEARWARDQGYELCDVVYHRGQVLASQREVTDDGSPYDMRLRAYEP